MPKKKAGIVDLARYRRPARYREFTYDEMPGLEDGAEPLRVTVQSNLSFAELDAIPYGAGTPYVDVFKAIAPYVTAWNVQRVVHETGQLEDVPPPAEVGWEILQVLDHLEANWLMDKVKFGYLAVAADAEAAQKALREALERAKKNASRPSGPTDGPSSADDRESA